MAQNISDYLAIAVEVLVVLGLSAAVGLFLLVGYLAALFVLRAGPFLKEISQLQTPAAVIAPPPEEAKPKAKEMPGRSCGHCGARIKTDPIHGIALDDQTYNVYACPICRKKTAIPVKPA